MIQKLLLILLLTLPSFSIISAQKAKDKTAILKILEDQSAAWNRGDLEGFMDGYWRSDSLKFIGSRGLTMGWDQTLANYKKSYPDKAAMGKLTFTILEVEALGKKHMLVIGKWHLKREKDEPQGHFSLTWRKIKGEWKIIADHSS